MKPKKNLHKKMWNIQKNTYAQRMWNLLRNIYTKKRETF